MDITEYPINHSETSKEQKDKDNDKGTTSSVVSYDDDSMDVESNDEYVILTSWMNKNLGLSNILFIVDDKSTNSRKYNLWTMRLRIPLRGADYPFTIRQKYLFSLKNDFWFSLFTQKCKIFGKEVFSKFIFLTHNFVR